MDDERSLAELAARADAIGAATALDAHLRASIARGERPDEDARSADWVFFAPQDAGPALVRGAGLGAAALRLARARESVVVVDASPARLQFVARRARDAGLANVTTLLESGPLPEGGFALVVGRLDDAPLVRAGGALVARVGNALAPRAMRGPGAASTLRTARRALGAAGFSRIDAYAPLPPATPLFLVPLDGAAPMRHFLRDLLPLADAVSPEAARGRMARERAVAKFGARLALATGTAGLAAHAMPSFLLVARRPGASPSALDGLGARLHASRFLGIPGSIEGGTTTMLAFRDDAARAPVAVVKAHRAPGAEAATRVAREADVLARLDSARLPGDAPRVLLAEGGLLAQSVVEGAPLPAALDAAGRPDVASARRGFDEALAWADALAQLRGGGDADGHAVVDAFSAAFPDAAPGYVSRTRASWPTLRAVLQHGDFTRHNLLVRRGDGRSALVDWTDARVEGFPLHDLLFFLATWHAQARREPGVAGLLAAFRRTFHDEGPFAALVRDVVARHARACSVKPAEVEPLFGLFLMERALFERGKNLRARAADGQLPRFALQLADEMGLADAADAQIWSLFLEEHAKTGVAYVA